jgi:hypothetical protein
VSEKQVFKTSELKEGDVVLTHGLRVRLDEAPLIDDGRRAGDHGPIRSFRGTVIERLSDEVPQSWTSDGRWVIQGNDLATWVVEPRQRETS